MKTLIVRSVSVIAGAFMLTSTVLAQEPLDRTKRPAPLPIPTVNLPQIQKLTLPNGLRVWLVEKHQLPTVAMNLVLPAAGNDHDPLTMPGIADMTASVLDAGTATMDALKIAARLDYIAARLSVRAGTDASTITLTALTKHLDEALTVFAEVVTQPIFPASEFERIRKQHLTSLLQQKDRATVIASVAFSHIIYGKDHPYGSDPSGTEASLKAMTRDDLAKFYGSFYRPNGATLIIVGDVTMKDLAPRLEQRLGGWAKAEIPAVTFPATPTSATHEIYLIDKPGAPQSEIRIGYPCLSRSTPEYFPLVVMNRILGGQFSSRINLNLREKRGFTYGARSGYSFNRMPGPFVAQAGVVSAKTDTSVVQFLYEIDRMYKDGMTPEELAFSKKGLLGGFALGFETSMQIAAGLQGIVLYNLPENYFESYLQNIDKVTLDDVKRASHETLDSSKMAIVVVGDAKTIEPGLAKMNLGKIVRCDMEGNVVK